MAVSLSLKEMFDSGVHYGHKASRWHPRMKQFIHGKSSGIHIIDLGKTATLFKEALEFIHTSIADGKTMLFVATKLQSASIVEEYAKATSTAYVTNRWLGGTLTNFKTIKSRIRYFKNLKEKMEKGELDRYTKKEKILFQKEIDKFEKNLGGIQDLEKLPGFVFVTDITSDRIAITEAKKKGIPIVGFCDTNSNPDLIDYPIPCNDDAAESLKYMLGKINEIILDARMAQKKSNKKPEEKSQQSSNKAEKKISEKPNETKTA